MSRVINVAVALLPYRFQRYCPTHLSLLLTFHAPTVIKISVAYQHRCRSSSSVSAFAVPLSLIITKLPPHQCSRDERL